MGAWPSARWRGLPGVLVACASGALYGLPAARPDACRSPDGAPIVPGLPGAGVLRACSFIPIKHGPSVLPLNADVNSERGANGDAP